MVNMELTDEEFEALEEWLEDYNARVVAENVKRLALRQRARGMALELFPGG